MSRIFITGSADGLGQMAARLLVDAGHQVVLHGRSATRAHDAMKAVPDAETAVAGDLSSIAATVALAEQVNRLGRFDAVIHNAAVGYREPRRKPRCGSRSAMNPRPPSAVDISITCNRASRIRSCMTLPCKTV